LVRKFSGSSKTCPLAQGLTDDDWRLTVLDALQRKFPRDALGE
jgi:hypothetical protein